MAKSTKTMYQFKKIILCRQQISVSNISARTFLPFMIGLFVTIIPLSLSAVTAPDSRLQIRYIRQGDQKYIYLRDVATYYGMECFVWKDHTVLSSKYSKLIFYSDKRSAELNGVSVSLLFAPFTRGIQSFINYADFLYTVDPLLRSAALIGQKPKVIVIDPGHGGKDKGGAGTHFAEKNIVLSMAKKLSTLLQRQGFRVVLTRNNDTTVSLQQRVNRARSVKADLYISLHANIAADKQVSGVETFCMTPAGTPSTYSNSPSNNKESGNLFDQNNMALAFYIQQGLIKRTKATDRGVRRARFYVLRNVNCPAVLVETGFLSNRNEESKLNTNWYQNLIVRGIAEGILRYHRRLIHQ